MQIGSGPTDSDASDVPAAMRDASRYGQRPAVVVIRPSGRQEQGFGTLLQWASKVGHWLQEGLGAQVGDRLGLTTPAGWLPAAAALGAWWSGLAVAPEGAAAGEPAATVAHEDADPPDPTGPLAAVGDGFDGGPQRPGAPGEPLPRLVQLYPDDPPDSRGGPDHDAIDGTEPLTQQQACERARGWDVDGPVGLSTGAAPGVWLPAVALRPLLTGRPTVVLDRVGREAAEADGIAGWVGGDG